MKDQDKLIDEKKTVKKDEIDLILLAKSLWKGRGTIIKTIIIFTFLGLFVALFTKNEYTASSVMVPQVNNTSPNLGGLSSLASLAGFNMNMNAGIDAISPMLYPMIVSSTEFQLEIMNSEYQVEETEEPISLLDYYINVYKPGLFGTLKKYTVGLPGLIISAIRNDQLDEVSESESETIKLTLDQDEVREIIEENLRLEVNDNEGYLTIVSRFHQAYLSAQVAQKAQVLLQEYVTKIKVKKAAAQLEFVQERYEEKKSEFEEAQSKLAAFRDANKNISSEIMRTQEERLQNEYQLAFDVYSELAKQLEQSLIQVEEDTPVLSIITEVVVPIENSKPNRKLILFVWVFLGVILGIGIVIGRSTLTNAKTRWKEIS